MGVKQMLSKIVVPRLAVGLRKRANRVAPVLSSKWEERLGVGRQWMPLSYGEYYPRSSLVYSAIKVRQDAIVRVPLKVYRRRAPLDRAEQRPESAFSGSDPSGALGSNRSTNRQAAGEAVDPGHPVQRLLGSPNPFWNRGDLWRATETYLGLWGSAYWGLERDERGQVVEIWPLRSDRMRVVPDPDRYIKGFVYVGQGQQLIPYVPEDMVWIHYFNPLDEYAGLSPIAPLRLSADMGLDALRASRNTLTNDSTPGLFIETTDTPTDEEVREFYERWESRFKGVDKGHRPVLLSGGMKAGTWASAPRTWSTSRACDGAWRTWHACTAYPSP